MESLSQTTCPDASVDPGPSGDVPEAFQGEVRTSYEIARAKTEKVEVSTEKPRRLKVSDFARKDHKRCKGTGILGYDVDKGRRPVFCSCLDREAFLKALKEL